MSYARPTDCFIVVNGPEDGTEFPVVRTPLFIGKDPACAIHLRLDPKVRDRHAQATVVADGYRVRRWDTAPVYVQGKRAGAFRSRVVRAGGTVQVGNTLLLLECAPDGLARRSHGVAAMGDLQWAVRQAGKGILKTAGHAIWWLRRMFGRLFASWLAIAVILFILMAFWPQFRHGVIHVLRVIYYSTIGP